MGLIKANNYNSEEWEITLAARALAHPARKRIIELLLNGEAWITIDFPKKLNLSQSTVSNHLRTLREAKLIEEHYHIHFNEIVVVKETLKMLQEYLGVLLDE